MRFSLKKASAGVFLGISSLTTLAFIGTEATGHDICMPIIRDFNADTHKTKKTTIIKAENYDDYAGKESIWKIRLAATPFPFSNITHTSLEFLPFNVDTHTRNTETTAYQIHGVIVKRKDGTPSSVTPCDAVSIYNQAAGNNLLKGVISEEDMNTRLLGTDPVLYIDLKYGTEKDIKLMLDEIKIYIQNRNNENIIYRFHSAPNSNSFVHALLEQLNINIPTKELGIYSAPGIEIGLNYSPG